MLFSPSPVFVDFVGLVISSFTLCRSQPINSYLLCILRIAQRDRMAIRAVFILSYCYLLYIHSGIQALFSICHL